MSTQTSSNLSQQLCPDRRGASRSSENATIKIRRGGLGLVSAPLIESTSKGARLVLPESGLGSEIEFEVVTSSRSVKGMARVAWTSPLSNGFSVVGLEFTRVRISA